MQPRLQALLEKLASLDDRTIKQKRQAAYDTYGLPMRTRMDLLRGYHTSRAEAEEKKKLSPGALASALVLGGGAGGLLGTSVGGRRVGARAGGAAGAILGAAGLGLLAREIARGNKRQAERHRAIAGDPDALKAKILERIGSRRRRRQETNLLRRYQAAKQGTRNSLAINFRGPEKKSHDELLAKLANAGFFTRVGTGLAKGLRRVGQASSRSGFNAAKNDTILIGQARAQAATSSRRARTAEQVASHVRGKAAANALKNNPGETLGGVRFRIGRALSGAGKKVEQNADLAGKAVVGGGAALATAGVGGAMLSRRKPAKVTINNYR